MSYITSKQLIGLPVYTESGTYLGKVADFEIDAATQGVLRYIVKGKIFAEKLIIAATQVVSLGPDRIIVRDGSVKEVYMAKKEQFQPEASVSGVAMAEKS